MWPGASSRRTESSRTIVHLMSSPPLQLLDQDKCLAASSSAVRLCIPPHWLQTLHDEAGLIRVSHSGLPDLHLFPVTAYLLCGFLIHTRLGIRTPKRSQQPLDQPEVREQDVAFATEPQFYPFFSAWHADILGFILEKQAQALLLSL